MFSFEKVLGEQKFFFLFMFVILPSIVKALTKLCTLFDLPISVQYDQVQILCPTASNHLIIKYAERADISFALSVSSTCQNPFKRSNLVCRAHFVNTVVSSRNWIRVIFFILHVFTFLKPVYKRYVLSAFGTNMYGEFRLLSLGLKEMFTY